MNLISNCCIAGYLYKIYNEQFLNPFQWCFIEPTDLIKLMRKFNILNYDNIKLVKSIEHENSYVLIIDDLIKLKYIHYIEDKNVKFKKSGHNIKSSNIKDYIIKKYKERLKRMKKELPVFIYIDKLHKSSDETTLDFIHEKTKFKRILITNNQNLFKYRNDNLLIIIDTNKPQTEHNRPKDYADRYYSIISKFISK